MQYISNIRLYEYCGIDAADIASLDKTQVKRIITAEFSMAPDNIIRIDGFEYNRNDILVEIDSPDWEKLISYHRQIWENPFLLNLLEKNTFHLYSRIKTSIDDQDFIDFLSPYLSHSAKHIFRTQLIKNNFGVISSLMNWLNKIDFTDKEEAYSPIRVYINDAVSLFKNLNSDNIGQHSDDIYVWQYLYWQHMVNELPDSMYSYKSNLAVALVNFTARVQKVHIGLVYDISSRLVQLKGLDADIEDIIKGNHKIYSSNNDVIKKKEAADDPGNKKVEGMVKGCLIYILIMAFIIPIVKKCNGSSGSRNRSIRESLRVHPESKAFLKTIMFKSALKNRLDKEFADSLKLVNLKDAGNDRYLISMKGVNGKNDTIVSLYRIKAVQVDTKNDSFIEIKIDTIEKIDRLRDSQTLRFGKTRIQIPGTGTLKYTKENGSGFYALSLKDTQSEHLEKRGESFYIYQSMYVRQYKNRDNISEVFQGLVHKAEESVPTLFISSARVIPGPTSFLGCNALDAIVRDKDTGCMIHIVAWQKGNVTYGAYMYGNESQVYGLQYEMLSSMK